MRKSLGGSLLLVVICLSFGHSGMASAAEQLPRCSGSVSITDAEIEAPKRVAAGRQFDGRYELNPDHPEQISKIRVRLIPKKGKPLVWKTSYKNATWEFWLDLADKKSQFRVDWIETTETEDGSNFICQDSIRTSITPWEGRGAKFRVRHLPDGEVEWRLKNGKQLCGGAKKELQTTTDYYQLRIRGANGSIRSTVGEICDGFEKSQGKKSGKWEVFYWYSGRYWDFYPIPSRLKVGQYDFKWGIYREKKKILYGSFGLRVGIG